MAHHIKTLHLSLTFRNTRWRERLAIIFGVLMGARVSFTVSDCDVTEPES